MREWTSLAIVAVATLTRSAAAMQASDVGLVDWHLPLIGAPRVALAAETPLHRFHHTSASDSPGTPRKSLLLTVTEENVLAALQPRSGDVVWRRRFSADEPHPSHLSCTASSTIVLSGPSRSDLSALNGLTGAVEWTRRGPRGLTGAVLCWQDGLDVDLMWLTSNGLSRVNGKTGEILWTWTSPAFEGGAQQLARIDQDRVAVLHISPQEQSRASVDLHILNSRDGTVAASRPSKSHAVNSSNFVLVGAEGPHSLVWVDKGSLTAVALGPTAGKPSRLTGSGSAKQVEDIGLAPQGVLLVRSDDGSATVVSCVAGKLTSLWQFGDASSASLFSAFVDRSGEPHIGHLSFSSSLGLASLQILSLGATEASPTGVLTGHTFAYDHLAFGPMLNFAFEAAPAKDYAVATRTFISTATGTIQAWEGTHLAWSREEGLSTVNLPPLFWDPVMTSHESGAAALLAHSSFLARAQRHLHGFSDRLTAPKAALNASVNGHQLVFVASSPHRSVYAVDLAQSGRIVWRAHVPSDGFEWSPRHRLQLQETATGRQVVALSEPSSTLFQLDALTGDRVSEVAQVLVPGPSSPISPTFGVTLEVASHVVQGLLAFGDSEPIWSYRVGEQEHIQAVVTPTSGVVASPGRVLGDRSTLLKYLNPNLVAIVAISPATTSAAVHLIDSATGSLVHQIEALQDVNDESQLSLILQDNWIVLSYRLAADAARSPAIVSVELFHDSSPDSEEPHALSTPVRAFSRTFSSAQPLDIKTITRTKLGITTYSAIFTNSLDQLVAIPRRILDPRRTFGKPSKYDQEELLLPYEALLPSDPRWILSHQTSLLDISRVDSFPGRLESESLLLATGLDFFGTRTSPSRSFDVLSPTFNKIQLVVTISILSVALGVTRSMVRSRQVRQKWFPS